VGLSLKNVAKLNPFTNETPVPRGATPSRGSMTRRALTTKRIAHVLSDLTR